MNYESVIKEARINAVREFFKSHGNHADDHYLEWFYENFLGICKNLGYLYGNDEPFSDSPYAEFALHIYALGH
jgi:hypothetical protein